MGVAKAFGVAAVEEPLLAKMLRDHYKERCTEGHLRMALVPEGATLESSDEIRWPTIRFGNVWLMPGVPEIFRMKLPGGRRAHRCRARASSRARSSRRWTRATSSRSSTPSWRDFPDVGVGSYPKWQDPTYRTKLTFDGRDVARVDEARDAFVALLPEGEPQRME